MDDFRSKVERMEGVCFISFFFPSGTYTHIHTSSIHTLVLTHGAGHSSMKWTWAAWTLTGIFFFLFFFLHCGRIYGALYTYLNELLTIKNSLKHSREVRREELTQANDQSPHNSSPSICYYTNTNRIRGRCMHTIALTHMEKYDIKADRCTYTTAANRSPCLLLSATQRLLWEWSERNITLSK